MTNPERAHAPQLPPPETPGRAGAPPRAQVIDIAFTEQDLFRLRAEVAAHAAAVGNEDVVHRVLIVTSELATNAIRHGGGSGRLRLWTSDHVVVCEVADDGPGIAQVNPGTERPDPMARGGRGIWFCRQLADEFELQTGPGGTTATAEFTIVNEVHGSSVQPASFSS